MTYQLYPPEPTYTCLICRRVVTVTPDGRGFPPDIAKRKLIRICKANGCDCNPQYQAGLVGFFNSGVGTLSSQVKDHPRSGEAAPERSEGKLPS